MGQPARGKAAKTMTRIDNKLPPPPPPPELRDSLTGSAARPGAASSATQEQSKPHHRATGWHPPWPGDSRAHSKTTDRLEPLS